MRTLITILLLISLSTAAVAETANPFGENLFLAKYKIMTLSQLRKEMADDVPTKRGGRPLRRDRGIGQGDLLCDFARAQTETPGGRCDYRGGAGETIR